MLLDAVKHISAWITEHGGANVLREHLGLLQARAVDLERNAAKLEKENASLRQRADQLESELARYRAAKQFTEGPGGALFKRGPDGAYALGVYCPKRHQSTSSFPPNQGQYCCDACRWFSDFEAPELGKVIAGLPKP